MNEEERFQQWLNSKGPDGRPVWAPEGPDESTWRDRPLAQFFKSFLKTKGGFSI